MDAMFSVKFDFLLFVVKHVNLKMWPIASSIPNVQTYKKKQQYHKSLFYNLLIV